MSKEIYSVVDKNDVVWTIYRRNHGEYVIKVGSIIKAYDIATEDEAFKELQRLLK